MANEDIVLNDYAFADKGVARDLAALADLGVFLHLNKRADLGLVSNFTTVKVDELGQPHIAPKLYIWRYAEI